MVIKFRVNLCVYVCVFLCVCVKHIWCMRWSVCVSSLKHFSDLNVLSAGVFVLFHYYYILLCIGFDIGMCHILWTLYILLIVKRVWLNEVFAFALADLRADMFELLFAELFSYFFFSYTMFIQTWLHLVRVPIGVCMLCVRLTGSENRAPTCGCLYKSNSIYDTCHWHSSQFTTHTLSECAIQKCGNATQYNALIM